MCLQQMFSMNLSFCCCELILKAVRMKYRIAKIIEQSKRSHYFVFASQLIEVLLSFFCSCYNWSRCFSFLFFYLMNNAQSYAFAETWFIAETDVISRTSVYITSNSFFDSCFHCLFLASLEIRRILLLIRASLLSVSHSWKSVSFFFVVASSLKEKQFSSAEDMYLF